MAREARAADVRAALRFQFPDLEENVSTPGADHPVEAIAVVLFAAAVLETTRVSRLVGFTGYPAQFISAVALNMRHNYLWIGRRYDCAGWFDPRDGIVDGDRFWADHEVAWGMAWKAGVEAISVDACHVYWSELARCKKANIR